MNLYFEDNFFGEKRKPQSYLNEFYRTKIAHDILSMSRNCWKHQNIKKTAGKEKNTENKKNLPSYSLVQNLQNPQ